MAPPDKIRIVHEPDEDDRFHYIGRLSDGTQFIASVTGAFPGEDHYPAPDEDLRQRKQWVGVIHKFDADGNYLASEIEPGGSDNEREVANDRAWGTVDRFLKQEGIVLCDINVRLFSTEIDGILYGLVYEVAVNEEGTEWESVMLWPNDIMFHDPWDDGEYSS